MRAHIPDLPDATEGTMASFTFPPESSPGVPEAWREVEAYKTEEGTFRERMPAGTYVFKLGRPRQAPGPIEGMRVVLVDPPTFTAPVRVVGGQHTVYDWTPGGFVVASTQPLLSDATRPTLASPPVPSVAPAGIPWRYLAVGSVVFVVGVGGAVLGYRALTMPVAR